MSKPYLIGERTKPSAARRQPFTRSSGCRVLQTCEHHGTCIQRSAAGERQPDETTGTAKTPSRTSFPGVLVDPRPENEEEEG